MSDAARPWCLHWSHDGELASTDRSDLLQRLLLTERGQVRQQLAQSADQSAERWPQRLDFSCTKPI